MKKGSQNMDLPDLVLIQVFKLLNIEEKACCSKVCRRFLFLIKSIPREYLCIHSGPFSYNKSWASTNVKLGYENSIEISPDLRVNHRFFKLNYSKIKRLYLDNCHAQSYFKKYIVDDMKSFLDQFKLVEMLEIHSLKLVEMYLELSCLKTLALKGCMIYDLEFNSPVQTLIVWNYFGEVKLTKPNTLKYFECDEYYADVQDFKSLETFTCRFRNPIDRNLIASLGKLKRLNLFSYAMFPSLLNELIGEKVRLNRLDLQISFQGFEVSIQNLLVDQLFFDDQNCYLLNKHNMALIRDNYEKIIYNIEWSTKLDYTNLEKMFKIHQVLESDFNFKFKNVVDIELNDKINDCRSFVQFIKNCNNNIQFLTIRNFENQISNVRDQQFFEHVSFFLPSLLDLKIELGSWSIDNYKFLDNFKNLMFIRFEYHSQSIDRSTIISILVDFVYNFFSKCKKSKEFVFRKDQLVIRLRYFNFYYFSIEDKNFTFNTLDDVMCCIGKIILNNF